MECYNIESFVGVGPLKFGMKRHAAHALMGPPESTRNASPHEDLLDYFKDARLQLTYSAGELELVEISLYPGLEGVEFRGIRLFKERGVAVMKKLQAIDPNPRMVTGVSIFLELGLATA